MTVSRKAIPRGRRVAVPAFFLICSFCALFLHGSVVNGICAEIVDDLGQPIKLKTGATRIIPLYGAFAEMLFSIGAGDQVIGRTQADTFPPELARLPSVGTHMRPNVEMILGLKPDLVIQSASRKDETPEISRLVDSGVPVAVFSAKNFAEIFSVVERLGVITGRNSEAAAFVRSLSQRLERVSNAIGAADLAARPKVFFEIRAEPLTGAGRGSIVNEILNAAGAVNAIKNDKAIVQYSLEALLLENPDYYIVQEGPMNKSPVPPAQRPHYDRLNSVRDGRIVFADEFIFSRPGPRCVDAVEFLAGKLHPGKFVK
ncbi:MAG: helical backbone metal receptor [Desulfobacteraceae bacterium]|nr:helical backbone metal receptor [Desulfobacteraceae bacterium]